MKTKHVAWGGGGLLLVIAVLLLCFLLQNRPPPGQEQGETGYAHLRWGNPSGATADARDRDNFLMQKKYYALSYNNTKGTPNWVSWRLVKEDVGDASREGLTFQPDGELPDGFKKILHRDYSSTGFDRGHMCPAKDRSSDMDALKATFVTTNVVPQSHANNAKAWEQLETYCRTLAEQGKELYIVAGPHGQGGEGTKGRAATIAEGQVVVPATTWKVVLVVNRGGGVDADARLLAVNVPNDETVGEDWSPFRASVRDVEKLTGYKFFDRADAGVLDPLKERRDR